MGWYKRFKSKVINPALIKTPRVELCRGRRKEDKHKSNEV